MFILGVGTDAPGQRYPQAQCWEAVQNTPVFHGLETRSQALLRRVLTGNSGISTRHLALDTLDQAFAVDPDTLQRRFETYAPALAAKAARKAMGQAHLVPERVDALLVSTCTGYMCPGLTSYVSELLGLRPNTLLLDLVGQGCGAAVPNLRAADALIASGQCEHVLSVCVEICSAAFFIDNDPGVLISACLFGDGAGAAVLGRSPISPGRHVRWVRAGSYLNPAARNLLRFEHKGGMLRNILAPEVPSVAADHASSMLTHSMELAGVKRSAVTGWIIHPGGREVLRAIKERLELSDDDLRWSTSILREFGNVSSSSVYFVLEAALNDSVPGGYWWLSTFGAGFSCHGALLEVNSDS